MSLAQFGPFRWPGNAPANTLTSRHLAQGRLLAREWEEEGAVRAGRVRPARPNVEARPRWTA